MSSLMSSMSSMSSLMRNTFVFILLFAASLAATAQQTVTIDSCNYVPTTGVLTINGANITALSLSSLTLTGGTSYPSGNYLTTITNGVISYTPYVPPATTVTTSAPTTPTTTGTTYSLSVPIQAAFATNWYQVSGATVKAGQVYVASPVFTGTPGQSLAFVNTQLFVSSTGALWLRIANPTNASFAATTFTVTVQ